MTDVGVSQSAQAPDQEMVTAFLESAMADFEQNPKSVRLLRYLTTEYSDLFFTAASKCLQSEIEYKAFRFLAALLIRQASFFEWLTNPARCPIASAVDLFKRLLEFDPTLDFKLARMLPGRNDSTPDKVLAGTHGERAIDILDQTSAGQRLLSVLGHLPNSTDTRIASKAALFVGRRVNNPAWTAKQLFSEDPRLRANAIEAAWGAKSEATIRIFEECAEDENDRVAGNAVIGLHLAGCKDVPERVLAMCGSERPGRRSTMAWVMGKTGCRGFIDCLTALLRDKNALVRSTAIRALAEIRRAESIRLCATPESELEGAFEPVVTEPTSDRSEDEAPTVTFEFQFDGSRSRQKS
jgi:hypothetical protein